MTELVWHKDGALAQVRAMAAWADGHSYLEPISPETARKLARNLRDAAEAIEAEREQARVELERMQSIIMALLRDARDENEHCCDRVVVTLRPYRADWKSALAAIGAEVPR